MLRVTAGAEGLPGCEGWAIFQEFGVYGLGGFIFFSGFRVYEN